MGVTRVQDRGRNTWPPSSGARRPGSEVSRWMRTQSAQPCTTFPTDGLIELHVDDGHGCGKEEVIAELLSFLSEKIEINCVQGIRHGSYEYLKTMKVREKRKLTSISNKRYLQSAMDMLGMSDCKWIGSPKLDKANMEGRQREARRGPDGTLQVISAHSVVSQQ